jgi:tRNA nucleotidyltransferase (CCA-adding enzyme)
MKEPFQKAKVILQTLIDHGYDAYIVGGSVRDFLQGTPIHDIDIATSAKPEEVISLFPKTVPVGIGHGTVLVLHDNNSYEVTTFRSESGYKDFRHPDQVIFEDSIEKDLSRRDFTMNAMAMDIEGAIIDPFNGQNDIKRRLIKTVGDASARFKEDPLRMLRAVRFVAQLNLNPDQELQKALVVEAPFIKHLAIERIREEFTKLLAGKWLDRGLALLLSTKLQTYLPFFTEGLVIVDNAIGVSFHSLESNAERWALFLISTGCQEPERFLRTWRFSKKDDNQITALINTFNKQYETKWDKLSLYGSGLRIAESVERMKVATGKSNGLFLEIQNLWQMLPIKNRSELAVNGTDLCLWLDKRGGPWTGQLLGEIEESVVLGFLKNDREVIQRWVQRVN